MAKNKQKTKNRTPAKREVDGYFDKFDELFQHPGNRMAQYLALPVFAFAVLGLIWMIPFPEIPFLKRYGYDTFLNWGSFFIAGMVYYYLRLAPTLSYAMLFTVGVFSFFIVQLEYVEQRGGPAVWMVCSLLLIISLVVLYAGSRVERRPISTGNFLEFLRIGPIWLWHFVFKKLNIPY